MMEDVLIPMPTIWIRSYPTIINMFLDDCQLAILSHDSSDTLFLQSTKSIFKFIGFDEENVQEV